MAAAPVKFLRLYERIIVEGVVEFATTTAPVTTNWTHHSITITGLRDESLPVVGSLYDCHKCGHDDLELIDKISSFSMPLWLYSLANLTKPVVCIYVKLV